MTAAAITVSLALIVLGLAQLPFVVQLALVLRRAARRHREDTSSRTTARNDELGDAGRSIVRDAGPIAESKPQPYEPRVAVILCLRGSDPFLADCIRALLDQDYRAYDVHIVIDHQDDPAWKIAGDVMASQGASHVHLQTRQELRCSCSLLNTSLVQAIKQLDNTYEVVVKCDADVIAHRTWLRELVRPLQDDRVAACAGNRWYMPRDPTWGALIRYIWNVGAFVQMYYNHYTWGGSLALRMELLRRSDLLDRWLKALAEDTSIYDEVHRQGYRTCFVPSIVMVNRETCDLWQFYPWLKRQLLLSRLYHSRWPIVIGHGLLLTGAIALGAGIFAAGLVTRQWPSVAWAGGGLLAHWAVAVLLVGLLEHGVRTIVSARGENTRWLSAPTCLKLFLALPLTQLIYTLSLLQVVFMREVHWRGIDYVIHGPYQIRMREYSTYRAAGSSKDATETAASL